MANKHYLNGALVDEKDLLISPRDMGYARGYAVFDFMRTYNQRPFLLDKHAERLLNSAKMIGLSVPWNAAQIADWVRMTLEANDRDCEKFIKIILSAAEANGMRPKDVDPTRIIQIDDAPDYPPEMYENGIGMLSVEHRRHLPLAKTNAYIEGVRQTQEAAKIGAYAPLYYYDGIVSESSNANVFAVIDGALVTPKSHLLPGLTRRVLLDILKLDIPIREADFTLDAFRNAAEAFSTDSGKEVVPVTKLDGKPIGSGGPGPVTCEVMRQFGAYTHSGAW